MGRVWPASTNDQYRGRPISAWFVILLGLGWIGPGLIHSFLPDGGAGSIAGIDLSMQRDVILGTFAWAGATQIAHGLLLVAIGWRYRSLVPLALILSLLERVLLSLAAWLTRAPASGHHPPEHYGSLILVPVIFALFVFALQDRERRGASPSG